jgi:O-antigen ligase
VAGIRGDPLPVASVLAGAGATLFLARAITIRSRAVVPAAVLAATALVAIGVRSGLLDGRPLSGPFGYANATGAFFMLASIAGLMLAVGSGRRSLRAGGVVSAVGAALVPVVTDVAASTVLLIVLPLPVLLLARTGRRRARLAIGICGGAFAAVLITTIVLGARGWSQPGSSVELRIRDVLTYNRLELWHEAEQLMVRNPVRGIGPGRFGQVAPLSLQERSSLLFWAQHDFLQQGAEQGIPGLMLLVALFGAGFWALRANREADEFVALAASALAAAGIQACGDYVLHFPAVSLTVAALVGAGIAEHRST